MAIRVSQETKQLQDLGTKFRRARRAKEYSIAKVELMTGISSVTITNLEKGRCENPTFQTLHKIAKALELKLDISITE